MTVRELREKLLGVDGDLEIVVTVRCPHGGNDLPSEVDRIVVGTDTKALFIDLSPADGVEYEVFDAEEEEEEEDEDND